MENILQVKDLKKVFHQHGKRDVTAVENMSFSLRAGENEVHPEWHLLRQS